jgi:CubicO group peptidase (beta-lactamase class C family)
MRTIASTINRILCALFIFFLLANPAFAQNKSSELDKLFTYYNENGMFNGIVLAAENGKVIYKKALGFSDFENKIPLDTSSVFCIGSITKPYTALAIMMLKERGLLSYEDKLIDYFPEFPDYAKPITIRHLLTHTSGLMCLSGP